MSEPLSRELCESLAQAYPEVKAHLIGSGEGDLYWPSEEAWQRGLVCQVYGGYPDSPWLACGDEYGSELRGALWCPRLEDLLGIAVRGWTSLSEPLVLWWHFGVGDWLFGSQTADWIRPDAVRATTSTEAVAAWLMAQKEGGV